MYEMSQRHPVSVAENHVNPCNSVGLYRKYIERSQLVSFGQTPLSTQPEGGNNPILSLSLSSLC